MFLKVKFLKFGKIVCFLRYIQIDYLIELMDLLEVN